MTSENTKIIAGANSVSIEQRGDLDVLVIQNAAATAEILLQGAQLIAYTPTGQKPVIWRSAETFYESGTPIRGGIPVIGPWFGDLPDNPESVREHVRAEMRDSASAHGFLRNSIWELGSIEDVSDDLTGVTCTYSYGCRGPWYASFDVSITFEIGATLDVILEITNTSPITQHVASALHTYFAISDVKAAHSPSFDGVAYIDALDGRTEKIWRGDVCIDREVDVVFLDPPPQQKIIDEGWGREITIASHESKSAVLWNPWTDKAKGLSMFGDEEYKEMLAIETGRLATDIMTIPSGKSESYGVNISL